MRSWRLALGAAALAVPLLASPLRSEEFRWLAFGDSITLGNYDFAELGGYPGRLSTLLGCAPGVCEVFNAGKSGEKTFQGVTRIDLVLDDEGPFDVMMLMEGTNDIFREYSVEAAVTNLGIMANKARARGTEPVHASIIWFHPGGTHGTTKDDEVEFLRDSMASMATTHQRYFVDIWDVLCPDSHSDVHGHNQTQCFNQHYSDTPPDDRGHPIGSGYTMMANAFYNGLTSVPVPGIPDPVAPIGVGAEGELLFHWNREAPTRATWYRLTVREGPSTVLDEWLEASVHCGAAACSYQTLLPWPDGDYAWRARGRNPAGSGPWSPEKTFQVLSDWIFVDGFESGDSSAWSGSD